MARKRHKPFRPPTPRAFRPPPKPRKEFFAVDQFSVNDIKTGKILGEKALKYHWGFYAALAFQRAQIADKLRASLLKAAKGPFEFKEWRRHVRYKYLQNPLSPAGSIKAPGGRFNFSDINPDQFPPFPALYLAEDSETALIEARGQPEDPSLKLNPMELALERPGSFAMLMLKGRLDTVIDLEQPEGLADFMALIKDFEIPEHVFALAKDAGLDAPQLVTTIERLKDALLAPNWRGMPMQCEVPASSQIFGQLVTNAGVEGIIYPSKFNGKRCLAAFPHNLINDSFIELAEEPLPGTLAGRLDAKTWPTIRGTAGS